MKRIKIEQLGKEIAIRTNERVLNVLLAEQLNVPMACGGNGMCATCHVYIKKGNNALTPMGDRERRTLSLITSSNEQSRLSCQARVLGDGVVVECPQGMYIEKVADLYELVGRRSETDILHPIDGRVLVEKGKIITRSRIRELEFVSFDYNEMMELKQASTNVLYDTRAKD